MTAETPSNDDWLADQSKSLAPSSRPTEAELRRELEAAPVVAGPGRGGARNGDGGDPGPQPRDEEPDPRAAETDRVGGRWATDRPHGEIYEGCPVRPLGVKGAKYYFLDVLGQLREATKLDAQTIKSLFGHQIPGLCYHFPKWRMDPDTKEHVRKPGHFDHEAACNAMFEAAAECGLFNPDNAVRGVGAWTDDDGRLIYHMGDRMIVAGEEREPCRIGRRIYPAYPPIPRPARTVEKRDDPVPDIMDTLETWNWADKDAHPYITLGMIGVQMLGGALDWRPVFWLTAAAGSGKSELQKLMRLLHGDEGLIRSEDATKSGITSRLGHSSLPVALDELEPGDERSNKEKDIVTLARIAASGGEWSRGSSDQTGVGGKVFSSFLFSSIIIPGVLKAQDVQRLIRLDLDPLPKDAKKLTLTPATWRARGARLKRLLIDRWPGWAERLADWRASLEKAEVRGRDADNWSAVLAMADMAMSETIEEERERDRWAQKIAWIVASNKSDTSNDAEAMLQHLLSQPFEVYRSGEQFTVAQWVLAAAGLPGAPEALLGRDTPGDTVGDTDLAVRERGKLANAKLAKAGIRIEPPGGGLDARMFLANSPTHYLKQFFFNSDWAGGAWQQSARRVPGAEVAPNPLTLAGMRSRGTFMPLSSMPGFAAFPMDRDKTPADPARADIENPEHYI